MPSVNEQIIRLLFQLFNERDWQAIEKLYGPKVKLLHPFYKNNFVVKNKWDVAHRYAALRRKYVDVQEQIQSIYAEGDQVFVHFIIEGEGPLKDKFSLPCWSIFTLQAGVIVKDASYYSVPHKHEI